MKSDSLRGQLMQATTQTTNGHASGPMDPAVLALLRCPATKETLREVMKPDGTRVLTNASGTREYAFVRGIAVLIAAK
jgi:uncharacterized protein YbaR (Trm112 family)